MKIENGYSVKPSELIASFEQEADGYYDEYDKKKHFKISYDLRPDEIKLGLKRFQKENRQKRRYLYIALCLVVVLVNFYDMVFRHNISPYNYFFIGASFAVIYIIIYTPILHRNNIAKAVANEKLKFSMRFYDDLIYIKQSEGSNRIPYTSLDNKFIEDDKKFMVICSDQSMYIVPKRCLNDEKIEKIREYAKKFEERYIVETKGVN